MDILYQCNDKYAPYCGVSVTSLFENNKDADNITVYILDDEISETNKEKFRILAKQYNRTIVFLETESIIKSIDSYGIPTYRGSHTANLKMFINEYIPDSVERLLYIDSDTVVGGSLSELFQTAMEGKPIGMSYDSLVTGYKKSLGILEDEPYYNSGVLLFDVNLWKEQKRSEQIIRHTQEVRAHYASPDQDLINVVIGKDILPISAKYNYEPAYEMFSLNNYYKTFKNPCFYSVEELNKAKSDVRIYHFFRVMGEFPWHKGNMHPFNNLFDKYMYISPWNDYIKQPSNAPLIFKCEKIAYRVLPECIFIKLFRLSHEMFMKKSNKLSLNNENSKLM